MKLKVFRVERNHLSKFGSDRSTAEEKEFGETDRRRRRRNYAQTHKKLIESIPTVSMDFVHETFLIMKNEANKKEAMQISAFLASVGDIGSQ